MFRVSLSFKEAVTTKYKTKWLSVINDELNNLYDNNMMSFVKKKKNYQKVRIPIKNQMNI